LLLFGVLGCASASPPVGAPKPPVTADAPVPAPAFTASPAATAELPDAATTPHSPDFAVLVSEVDATCTGATLSIRIPTQSSSLVCKDGFRECEGEIPVTIDNCLGVEVAVKSLYLQAYGVVGERASGWTFSKPWPAILPGMSVTRNVDVRVGARYIARLEATSSEAGYGLSSQEGEVINTAYFAAKASCKACQGDWGPHGILQLEGCVCRARDRGRVCYDGDACEGYCLFDHIEKLGHGLGRNAGKCSEFIGGFGCISYLQHGESKLPPRPLAELGPTASLCAD